MSIDEIVNEIIQLVRARDTNGGHFHQEPYKGDFFRLFIAAWDAGLLKRTGPNTLKLDSLISIVGDRDPTIFDGETWLTVCLAARSWDPETQRPLRESRTAAGAGMVWRLRSAGRFPKTNPGGLGRQ